MMVRRFVQRGWLGAGLTSVALAVFASGCGEGSQKIEGGAGGGGGASGALCGAPEPKYAESCAGNAAPGDKPDCSKLKPTQVDNCGVLVAKGTVSGKTPDTARSNTVKEFGGDGAVDLSCFQPATYPKAGASQTVDIVGFARNFSNGCDSANVQIEVYKVKRTGGADDGELGELVGTPVAIADTPCTQDTDGVCKLVDVKTKCEASMSNPRVWRAFAYKGVPTETELVIKTGSQNGKNDWATLYDYNIYIPNAQVKDGKWEHDVRAVISSDYSLIPTVAYGKTLTSGYGAIAGEVHDCGDVRLSNASVDVSAGRYKVGYFTDLEDAPLPDPSRDGQGTSTLGLYAAYDLKPGPVRVSAIGQVGGETVTLGYYDVRVFPDAVTAVTFRGMRPFQAPKQLAPRALDAGTGVPPTTEADAFFGGALALAQPARGEGYRLNVDAFLVAREALSASPPYPRAIDLGAGVGAVGLSLLALGGAGHVTLVEREPLMASLARGNTLPFAGRAEVVEADVASFAPGGEGFDLVVSNPPFTLPGEGRAPPEPRRGAARHGELRPFLEATARLLAPRGLALFVYPAPSLPRLLADAARVGLAPRSLRLVHPAPARPARVGVLGLSRDAGAFAVEPPWFERAESGDPDPELEAFLRPERPA